VLLHEGHQSIKQNGRKKQKKQEQRSKQVEIRPYWLVGKDFPLAGIFPNGISHSTQA